MGGPVRLLSLLLPQATKIVSLTPPRSLFQSPLRDKGYFPEYVLHKNWHWNNLWPPPYSENIRGNQIELPFTRLLVEQARYMGPHMEILVYEKLSFNVFLSFKELILGMFCASNVCWIFHKKLFQGPTLLPWLLQLYLNIQNSWIRSAPTRCFVTLSFFKSKNISNSIAAVLYIVQFLTSVFRNHPVVLWKIRLIFTTLRLNAKENVGFGV